MKTQENIFVTGGTGVIGSQLCTSLGIKIPETRFELTENHSGQKEILSECDAVVHCAALASGRNIPKSTVMSTNVEGTVRLAETAREAGAGKFVFLSSAKVFGEISPDGKAFTDESPLNPESVYGESKALAEERLMGMHTPGQFEIVVLRPTVVVSPSAKGAVSIIRKLASKGLPLPVIKPDSMRSFVSVDNLCSAIQLAITHPDASGKAFSVSDGNAISTKRFYEVFAESFGKRSIPLRVPKSGSRFLAHTLGKAELWQRLFGNFEIDSSRITKELNWKSLHTTEEYLRSTFFTEGALIDSK